MEGKKIAESTIMMTEMVLPNDTNPLEVLLGGRLISWMDLAAAICAQQHAEQGMVTASMSKVDFGHSVMKGEIVHVKAVPAAVFRRSMDVFVEVWKTSPFSAKRSPVTDAYFTFAIPKLGQESKAIPALNALSPEAEIRRKARTELHDRRRS